jgi:cytochrome P450
VHAAKNDMPIGMEIPNIREDHRSPHGLRRADRKELAMSGNAAPDGGPNGDQQLIAKLFSPAARADPYPLYQDAPLPGCRHAVASRMLKDPRLGPPVLGLETADELMWRTFARWLLNLDRDRHRAMRQRFARIFTPGRVERYRPAIEGRAHALIDAVATTGQMDLVTDFARPLPFAIVTSVLGVPEDRRPWLAERMHTLDTGFARQHDPNAVATASGAVHISRSPGARRASLDGRSATRGKDLGT